VEKPAEIQPNVKGKPMIEEPSRSFYPLTGEWRARGVARVGLQYELVFETLDDGSQQVVFDADTFGRLLDQAMGLRNMTAEQKAEIIEAAKAAEEGETHDD
jgi:hypothetical protein